MNRVIELHDSCVAGITTSGGSIVVRFRPAYVHRSQDRAGLGPGSVWLQDLDLVFSEAESESTFSEIPQDLYDGSLSVDDEVFENAIPFSLDLRGAVRFSAVGDQGEQLVIRGTQATAVPVGQACYLEQFPGTE